MEDAYRADVKEVLDDLLLGMPGIKGGKAFGYPAYKVGRRIFAFVGGAGVGIKLNEARVQELMAEDPRCRIFEPAEGYLWPGWVSIDLADPDEYREYLDLLYEAIELISG